jgi:hypothetical protein
MEPSMHFTSDTADALQLSKNTNVLRYGTSYNNCVYNKSYFLSFRGLFNDAFQYKVYIASDDMMIDEWWMWKDLGRSGHDLIEVLSRHFSGLRETSARIADVPAEIRTDHLPNTDLELYLYTNRLGNNSYIIICSASWHLVRTIYPLCTLTEGLTLQ